MVELLVLLIVLGILVSVALQSMTATMQDIRRVKTEREMMALAHSIAGNPELNNNNNRSDFGYVGDVGAFPPNLEALRKNPGGYATWDGPYLPTTLVEDTLGFAMDEWGVAYAYTGGISLTSNGSGSAISRKIADASDDYLLNSVSGTIVDSLGSGPGTADADSVDIVITIPNGAGSTTSKTYHPDPFGFFQLDSIPVGLHALDLIYTPANDTLHRYLQILPRHRSSVQWKFASVYFSGGGGTCDSAGTLVLRPTGPGTKTELSQNGCALNWECVGETVADDNVSRVDRLNGNYKTDTYAIQDGSDSACNISKVTILCRGQKPTIFITGYLKVVLSIGGSLYESSPFALNNSWTTFNQEWLVSPETGLPWTWDEVNSLEAGVSLRSNSPWFASKCTQVWVEVEYAP